MLEESSAESFKPSLGEQQAPLTAEDRPAPTPESLAETVIVKKVEIGAEGEVTALREASLTPPAASTPSPESTAASPEPTAAPPELTAEPASPAILSPIETPFSEQITRWLDDGDRMSESAPSVVRAPEIVRYQALRSFLERFRAENFRYRALIAGAVVLSVMVVGLTRHQAHQVPPETETSQPSQPIQPSQPSQPIQPSQPSQPIQPSQLPVVSATVAPPAVAAAPIAPAPATPPLADAAPSKKPPPRPRKISVAASRAAGQVQACKTALGKQNARAAIAACQVVAAATPRSADALVLLAKADLMAGRQNETLQLARNAVTLNPKYADAYLLVGSVQQTVGHKRDARVAYETYLQLAPRGRHAADVRSILRTL